MATFKEIAEANKTIKTTAIKGKEYAEVNQRIKAFRMLYPMGFIKTNIIELDLINGICAMAATVGYYEENGDERILGTGTAFEWKNDPKSMVNKTSYVENAETSCIGRALGMVGLGIDVSIASYEEVSNAIAQQDSMASDPASAPTTTPEPQKKAENKAHPHICERCGGIVKDTARAKAETIVKQSQKQFGKTFCMNCGKEYKKEQDEAKAKEANDLPFDF